MIQNCLINDKWLKEFSPYPLNYNTKEIQNYIKLAELMYVVPIIGQDFYEELLDQVKNNTLTPENSTALVEVLWSIIGFGTAYEALPLTWAKISEVGVVKSSSDTSEPLTLKDLTLVQQHLKNQLAVRIDYAKHWFCERVDSFPLLDQCGCGCQGCGKNKLSNHKGVHDSIFTTYRRNTNLK